MRVVLRKRPLLKTEYQRGERDCLDVQGTTHVRVVEHRRTVDLSEATEFHAFQFDKVYAHGESTGTIYEDNVRPLLRSALEGNRSTCFAYGQTKRYIYIYIYMQRTFVRSFLFCTNRVVVKKSNGHFCRNGRVCRNGHGCLSVYTHHCVCVEQDWMIYVYVYIYIYGIILFVTNKRSSFSNPSTNHKWEDVYDAWPGDG
jgi:hypothetical protein